MQAQNVNVNKIRNAAVWIFLLIGGSILLCAGSILGFGLYLDFFGGEATGQITNKPQTFIVGGNNSDGATFNPQVTFTASSGEEISFTPFQKRARYQMSKFLRTGDIVSYFLTKDVIFSGDQLETIDTTVKVSYLEAYPQIAKINFTYHIEFIPQISWLLWGLFFTAMGLVLRIGKSKVIDLRKDENNPSFPV